jgi:galacturonokinase
MRPYHAIFAPYRICPIGAHIDHQGAPVLGRTIALGTTLHYRPLDSGEIRITSDQLGETSFPIGAAIDRAHWARYAQAATRVLPHLTRGMEAHVSGALIGAGLSSSASVGLAYLKALADVNGLELSNEQLVRLDFELENGQLGLQNGILDPLTIVHGRRDGMLFMETKTAAVTVIRDPQPANFAWIIAYSGVARELTKSGYNGRVAECHQAAGLLQSGAVDLSEVPVEVFQEKKAALPDPLRRRAAHFFSEVTRVRLGAAAWAASDLTRFGQLMNESCASSIRQYEVGTETMIRLHEITSNANGVYGSRFSGGGYAGCVIALADRARAGQAAGDIAGAFARVHPELPAQVFVTEMGDGLSRAPATALPHADAVCDAPPSGQAPWEKP